MKRKQDTSFRVDTAAELMSFLLAKLGGMTRTSVKQLLSQRDGKEYNVMGQEVK